MKLLSALNQISCGALSGSQHVKEKAVCLQPAAEFSYLQTGKESNRAPRSEFGVRALKKDVTV